jgi:putative colanic acid biosynthesis glycosyltransferase
MTRLSIITVTRNNLEGLRRTVSSIKREVSVAIEHIVIDGASVDGTRTFLKTASSQDLSWISEPDTGIYDAMNKGIERARGEFILFLNAGDTLVEGALSLLFSASTAWQTSDVVYGNVVDAKTGQLLKARDPEYLSKGMPFCHQAVLVRATWSRRLPFDTRFRVVADFVFFLRAYSYGAKFLQTKICIAEFEGGGLSSRPSWATHRECATALWQYSPNGQRAGNVIRYWRNTVRYAIYRWAIRGFGNATGRGRTHGAPEEASERVLNALLRGAVIV